MKGDETFEIIRKTNINSALDIIRILYSTMYNSLTFAFFLDFEPYIP